MHSNHHDRMQWALVLVRMDSTVTLPCKVLSIYRPQNRSAAKVQQLCESLPGYTRTLLLWGAAAQFVLEPRAHGSSGVCAKELGK